MELHIHARTHARTCRTVDSSPAKSELRAVKLDTRASGLELLPRVANQKEPGGKAKATGGAKEGCSRTGGVRVWAGTHVPVHAQ
jgi:hypothetical protein